MLNLGTKKASLPILLFFSFLAVSPPGAVASEEGKGLTLVKVLGKGETRKALVGDCAKLVDGEVSAKSGLSGLVIKGAYGVIKTVKEDFVPNAVNMLLIEWLRELEPFYQDWQKTEKKRFSEYLTLRSGEVSEALLKVTDRRIKKSRHATVRGVYDKLRDKAKENVTAAIPGLGKILEAHLKKASK